MSVANLTSRIDGARSGHQRAKDLFADARGKNKPEEAPRPADNGGGISASDIGHTVLDVAGFIPVVGAVADLANAAWYAAEGDYLNAGLSAVSAVPGVGDAAGAARLGIKGANVAGDALRATDNVADASDAARAGGTFVGCFVAGTKVLTPEGKKSIESLVVGNEVYAYDPVYGKKDIHKISQTFVHIVPVVIDIKVGRETITCSPEHPFWVPDFGWKKAGELSPDDSLLTKENQIVKIDRLINRGGAFTVFNITVTYLHTYFVSDLGILVHNKAARYIPPTPSGSLKKRNANWFKRQGIEPHVAKDLLGDNVSKYDMFVDRNDEVFAIRKGAPEDTAEHLGHLDDLKDY